MSSPTQRSLEVLRELGYTADVVERFLVHVPPHGIRKDLFGLADLEAIADDHTLYVQATPASRLSDHVEKCLAEPRLAALIRCDARRFEIWSWGKRQVKGRSRWCLRRLRASRSEGGVAFVELAADVKREEGAA